MAVVNTTKTVDITVYGHKVKVPKVICGRKIAIFTFEELCSTALGAADYIDIGHSFHPSLTLSLYHSVTHSLCHSLTH